MFLSFLALTTLAALATAAQLPQQAAAAPRTTHIPLIAKEGVRQPVHLPHSLRTEMLVRNIKLSLHICSVFSLAVMLANGFFYIFA